MTQNFQALRRFVNTHQPEPPSRSWLATRVAAALALTVAAAAIPAVAGDAEIDLTHPTAASGGGVVESGPFRLSFTVGEPVAGPVSQAGYTVIGGLQATFVGPADPLPDGGIFSDSFEPID